jgi:hypothetical protein
MKTDWDKFLKIAKFITKGVITFVTLYAMINYLVTHLKTNEILQAFVINLLSGLIGSFIFIFLLLTFLRPKLSVSPYICLRMEGINESEREKYSFKILNRSIYHAFDVSIELFLMEPITHMGGNNNLKMKSLSIRTSNVTSIVRFRRKHYKKDPFALYAYVCHTNEPLTKYLSSENSYIEIRVTARHGLTGLSDLVIKSFGNNDVIMKSHKFAFGNSLKTVPINLTI